MTRKLGLIAGNGRFPFLVLDAARSLGYDITIIGIKEEASKELDEAAARAPRADLHWISIGQLGTFLQIMNDAGITQGADDVRTQSHNLFEQAGHGIRFFDMRIAASTVVIDGERWDSPEGGSRLIVELSSGSHRIEVKKEGFKPYTATLQIRPGQTETLNISLPPGGGQ